MTAPVDIANPKTRVRFCVCGCQACRKGDHLNCPHAECESRNVSLLRVERTNAMIVAHAFPLCRARILHVLGAAEEQGVLLDVLNEILGKPEEVAHIREHLRRHGWAK